LNGDQLTAAGGFFGVFRPAGVQVPAKIDRTQLANFDALAAASFKADWCEGCTTAQWHHEDNCSVVCRGEIYNAPDLRRTLGLAADTPLPRILLAAWRRWSVDFLPRLKGVIALALHNDSELLLYSDPSGLQSLFYQATRNGQVVFGTCQDTLPRLPGTQRRLARRSLHEYLRFLDIAAPNTLFDDVHAVPAGQLVRCSDRGVESMSWPVSANRTASVVGFQRAVEMLEGHLLQSVGERVAESIRPAAFLSGGIDSSLLCAMASRHRQDTTALTVGFDGSHYDEAETAQRVAKHLGLAHRVLRFSRQEYLGAFARLSQQTAQPSADPAAMATLLAFDYCHSRFDAVLDGTGADEACGAMPPRHVRVAVGYASILPVKWRRSLTHLFLSLPVLKGYAPILDFEHPAETMIRWRGFTRADIEELCGEPVSFSHTRFFRTFLDFPRRAHFERSSALLDAMPSDRLIQASLISGLQVRYPFCDPDTDRFIRQLRTDWRHLPGEPKRILRALLARYIPRNVWDLPKHGFDFPLLPFLAGDDFALIRRHLDPDQWHHNGLLRPEIVSRYAKRFMAGDAQLTFRVWALVVLGAWLEGRGNLR
jgi:asparagine synthase (glutamine-hydrolysing)